MIEMPDVMSMASAMARNASQRLGLIAQNVANADTPGYRSRSLARFSTSYQAEAGLPLRTTRSGHLGSGAAIEASSVDTRPVHLSPNGNGVSLEDEMVAAAGARRDHDLALAIYKNALGLLRSSLGRR
jgi:flagellar basal-body rod protein FlgB